MNIDCIIADMRGIVVMAEFVVANCKRELGCERK